QQRAAVVGLMCGEGTAVGGDDVAGDGQAKSGTAGGAGPVVVEADEPVEDAFAVFGRDASAVVGDGERGDAAGGVEAEVDVLAGLAGGVVEQVAHRALEVVW